MLRADRFGHLLLRRRAKGGREVFILKIVVLLALRFFADRLVIDYCLMVDISRLIRPLATFSGGEGSRGKGGVHFENCCFISVAILCGSSGERLLPDGRDKPPHLTDKN